MDYKLKIKELFATGVNRYKMLDFVEAEKCFLELLEIRKLNYDSSEMIDDTYREYISTKEILSLYIYPSIVYDENNHYLTKKLEITQENLKAFLKKQNNDNNKFNLDKILEFYNEYADEKIVLFGLYLAISNGVFKSMPLTNQPKFSIQDALKTDLSLTVFIIKSMIEKGEYKLDETNFTFEDLEHYISRSDIHEELVPIKVFSNDEKESLFNLYLDKYRNDSSLSKEGLDGLINVAFLTKDSIVNHIIDAKDEECFDKVNGFINGLKSKYSIN